MRARLDAAKPWMVEVLADLDQLRLLRNWMVVLEPACLAKIEEIALRNNLSRSTHPVVKDRRVANLDEACFVGSSAGLFLMEQRLRGREHQRLSAILEAERRKEEAERELRKLTAT